MIPLTLGWAVDSPLYKMTKNKGKSGADQQRSDHEDGKDELWRDLKVQHKENKTSPGKK